MSKNTLLHPHRERTGNEVISDLLADHMRRLQRDLADTSHACIHWRPDEEANSIAVTLWHMGRILDVFINQLILNKPAEGERWIANGWAEKTGYDPRGIGRDGWGSVNDYDRAEVDAMPAFELPLLLAYLEEVYGVVHLYLQCTPMDELIRPAPGLDGQYTCYQVLLMAVMDNVRHLGEIRLIKSLWARR